MRVRRQTSRAGALLRGVLLRHHIAHRAAGSSRACGAAACLALALTAAPALAAPNYPVAIGPGLATCRQVVHLEHDNPALADGFYAWAEGFMSGLNDRFVADNAAADLLPPNRSQQDQKDFLAHFCDAQPDAPYMQGVWALYLQMRGEQKLPR